MPTGGAGSGIGAAPTVARPRPVAEIGIGTLGYGPMARAHANAYQALVRRPEPPPVVPRLVSIAGRTASAVQAAAGRYGYDDAMTDWRDLVADPRIGLSTTSGRTTRISSQPRRQLPPASTCSAASRECAAVVYRSLDGEAR